MVAPGPDVLAWACGAIAAGARVVGLRSLAQAGGAGPWQLAVEAGSSRTTAVLYLGDPSAEASRRGFATEAAALEVAGRYGLAAPRLLAADLDGSATGHLALLASALEGSSRIPRALDPTRLRALGRGAAAIHAVTLAPTEALPLRQRALSGAGFEALEAPEGAVALFAEARRALERAAPPREPLVLVHGDLWQGNTLWTGDGYAGAVDWDYAGVGPAGVDLGSLRCDAAVMHGGEAADFVLEGWRQARGGDRVHLAWWDVTAALSTPPDMRHWLPNFHAQGRTDLDLATVTARRDAFMARALRGLG